VRPDRYARTTVYPCDTAGFPIQDINILRTNVVLPPTTVTSTGQLVYAQAAGSGFGVANSSGTSQWTEAKPLAGYAFANSCWDDSGNVYAAIYNSATGAVTVYSKTAAGGGALVEHGDAGMQHRPDAANVPAGHG